MCFSVLFPRMLGQILGSVLHFGLWYLWNSIMVDTKNAIKHIAVIASVYLLTIYKVSKAFLASRGEGSFTSDVDANFASYLFCVLESFTILVIMPSLVLDYVGWALFNPFKRVKLQIPIDESPLISFRLVTRGDYESLVVSMILDTIQKCEMVGLTNYMIEIVTDKALVLPHFQCVNQILVDKSFETKNKTKYKARALCYANEPGVSTMPDDGWIVHLDEESQLTEGSILGIVNFCAAHSDGGWLGTGTITYGHRRIESKLTSLFDCDRLGTDLGSYFFAIEWLNGPWYTFHGSFFVLRLCDEKHITLDFGPYGSITEDMNFALVAKSLGYNFGYVEGVVTEQSPFTISDFLAQRKRWYHGFLLLLKSPSLSWKLKLVVLYKNTAWTAAALYICLRTLHDVTNTGTILTNGTFLVLRELTVTSAAVHFSYGIIHNFNTHILFRLLIIGVSYVCMWFLMPVHRALDLAAMAWSFYDLNRFAFPVIQKDKRGDNRNIIQDVTGIV